MKCIIIEDQPPAQRILKKYIEEIGTIELRGVFSDALQALEFLKKEDIDLIFLDVHLPKLSGIEFLKTLSNPPSIILTTAFSDYALEGYELDVVDYLLKPFSFQRFVKAVLKATKMERVVSSLEATGQEKTFPTEIFIKSGHEYIRLNLDELLFIKSDADYTELHTTGKRYLSSEPLKYWLETLDQGRFVRVHRSYIINSTQMEKISGNQIYLKGGEQIPIGRVYKEDFVKRFIGQ